MRKGLSSVLREETFYIDIAPFRNKEDVFQHLAEWFTEAGIVNDTTLFKKALYEREALGSTFMGNSIALPHAKSDSVLKPAVLFCRTKEPFVYESGGEKGMVQYIFMLAVPIKGSGETYLRMLANLAGLLAKEEFLEKLKDIETRQELLDYATEFNEDT
ncbi:fructose PTS transporter subunit IIA [Tetragenococcus koreensis]|uniref:PTS sugar transporter subunit IIA n=1 Tax=Tetragenococcus koreensis TaxID=290335 RepID=UPI000F4D92E6|nr:PTS sugar transporter subunit IIA [Tetragenococcus koreensis]MDN6626651.1 fructose PTS transporter subunit IIA [Pisciglobus halotolerans]MDN6730985.1 fructose PTS transporter subunit IIA [Atopostipes suicloacalis]AYW46508.1 PTS sugar transporter [Tetragenococcus koreensis]MCF1585336.1 fructose PTS transporter subunit IIA [Tetragenococcus koreensis]MCF1619760.1 fructose PTS transporter subunit IIA [Tetragenococcus koreensis]